MTKIGGTEWQSHTGMLALACAFLGALAGCGDGGGGESPDANDQAPDAAFCPTRPDGGQVGPANGQIEGRWTMLTRTLAQVQGFGGPQLARTVSIQQVIQMGSTLTVVETICSLDVDSTDGLTKVRVTPAFIAALPPQNRAGSIVDNTANGEGFTYLLETNYLLQGVTLTDRAMEALPTEATDPRVGDWDNDGNPGMTLIIDGVLSGTAYIIERDSTRSDGSQIDADHIRGFITWSSEQVYFGSAPKQIADLASPVFPDSDPNNSTFQLVRIPDNADCAWIAENACNLFDE